MKPTTVLRLFTFIVCVMMGMAILAFAVTEKQDCEQRETMEQSLVGRTSNNDFIFFEAISKVFVASVAR